MKTIHKNFKTLQKSSVSCPLCCNDFYNYRELDSHITFQHDIAIIHEEMEFNSKDLFNKWKLSKETEAGASFAFFNSRKWTEGKIINYVCHRSGISVPKLKESKRQRQLKVKGSNKIGRNCPARIRVVENLNGNLKIDCVLTHVGHSNEVGRLRLTQNERESIAAKMFRGIPNYKILEDITSNFEPEKRLSYTTNHDLHNIKKSFNIESDIIFDSDDAKSVHILIEKLQCSPSNPILAYKPFGIEDEKVGNNNFFLVFMNTAQREMLNKYGNDIIMIDATHGTNPYKIQLTTLMVVDKDHEGFPVAFLWSITQTEVIYQNFFSIIKNTQGNLNPKVFLSDDSNIFYNAFVSQFGTNPSKILCDWHVKRNLFENLSKVCNLEKRKELKKNLIIIINELDIATFQVMLNRLLDELLVDPETVNYGNYLSTYYANRVEQWAHCYRKGYHKNTNMSLEKWHHELKHNSRMNGKCQRRLDVSINNVLRCLRTKFLRRIISLSRNKVPLKLSELRKRHKTAEQLLSTVEVFEDTVNAKWLVPSYNMSNSTMLEYYEVRIEKAEQCDCSFICGECSSCLHTYSCTCHDFCIQYNMCKHIHMVSLKYPRKKEDVQKMPDENLLHIDMDPHNNNEEDSENEFIVNHLVSTDHQKHLEMEKKRALNLADTLKSLINISDNFESITYASKNLNSLICGFKAIANNIQSIDMIPTEKHNHNKKIKHQDRRLPKLPKNKKNKKKTKAFIPVTKEDELNLVLKEKFL